MANDFWQQQQMGMLNAYNQSIGQQWVNVTTVGTATTTTAGYLAYQPMPSLLPSPKKADESAIEWLDRRVAEMRVPL